MATVNVKIIVDCTGGEHITMRLTAGAQVVDRKLQRGDLKPELTKVFEDLRDQFIAARTPAQLKAIVDGFGIDVSITPAVA